MIFDEYSFIYFICEGTNEEEVLNWTIREDALNIDKENYSTDWSRVKGSKGKEKLIDEILTINHEEKDKNKVAVLFIHDRKTDEWLNKSEIKKFSKYADIITIKTKEDFSKAQELCRAHQMLNLDIIFINTAPEIELLLLIKNKKEYAKWLKGTKAKPSDVCAALYKNVNIKKQGVFISLFDSFDDFVKCCKIHKENHSKDAFCIYDLLKNFQ